MKKLIFLPLCLIILFAAGCKDSSPSSASSHASSTAADYEPGIYSALGDGDRVRLELFLGQDKQLQFSMGEHSFSTWRNSERPFFSVIEFKDGQLTNGMFTQTLDSQKFSEIHFDVSFDHGDQPVTEATIGHNAQGEPLIVRVVDMAEEQKAKVKQ